LAAKRRKLAAARSSKKRKIQSKKKKLKVKKIRAKRIGYIVTTGVTYGLRQTKQERDIRYWTYHHDSDHYAIVLVSSKVLEELDF